MGSARLEFAKFCSGYRLRVVVMWELNRDISYDKTHVEEMGWLPGV
jgi:hypothetical protein